MKMYLMGKDLWGIVQKTEVLANDATDKQRELFRKREHAAMACICLGIVDTLHIYVRSCETAAEAWENLQNHFEEKTLSRKIYYRRQLYDTKLTRSTTMEAHVNTLKTIAEHLESLGDKIPENDLVMILITSLTEDYSNLITTLETLKEEQLTWVYVRDRCLSEYLRKKGDRKQNQDHGALYTRSTNGAQQRRRNTNPNNNNQRNNRNNNNENMNQGRQNSLTFNKCLMD